MIPAELREMIKYGRVSNTGADNEQFPVQQVEFMGNVADAMMVFPYGMHANADIDAYSLLFGVNGQDQSLCC